MADTQDKQHKIEEVIRLYEAIHNHPRGIVSDSTMPLVEFIHGFETAMRLIVGISTYHEHFEEVCRTRGWQVNALHPIKQMREAQWDEAKITNELLEIEILTWARVLSEIKDQQGGDGGSGV